MAVNKVIFNKKTLLDLTNDTVTADKLFKGLLAHDRGGNQIEGTYEPSLPTGTKDIYSNGTFDVVDYANVKVNVSIPSDYIKPSGTLKVTENGQHDVMTYRYVDVAVPSDKVSIKKTKGWKGTVVPTTGIVETVYYNTNLSFNEVIQILETLNFVPFGDSGVDIWSCLSDDTMANGIDIQRMIPTSEDDPILYDIGVTKNGVRTSVFGMFRGGGIPDGWNENFNGVAEFNIENKILVAGASLGFIPENDKASSLFSTEPFTYEENSDEVHLTGNYDGGTVTVDIAGGWKGTAVPNDSYVENVYFNTGLSVDEVVNMLKDLPYKQSTLTDVNNRPISMSFLFYGEDERQFIATFKVGDVYSIIYRLENVLFSSALPGTEDANRMGFTGWNPEITYPLSINCNGVTIIENENEGTHYVGTVNNKITSLFSTTLFIREEPNFIDMKKYINNKQLPLNVKINGPKIVIKNTNSGTPIPLTGGYIENIYLNIDMTPEEVVKIVDDAVFAMLGVTLETIETIEFIILLNEDDTMGLVFAYADKSYSLVSAIVNGENVDMRYHFLYSHDSSTQEYIKNEFGYIGWNPELQNTNGVLTMNINSIDLTELYEESMALAQAYINSLSPFLSTTPFSDSTEGIQQPSVPTPVPNTGYVENVYFNIDLSTDEVVAILDTLEDDIYSYDKGFENDLMHVIFVSETTGFLIVFKDKSKKTYTIGTWANTNKYYFNSDPDLFNEIGFVGWNPDFYGTIIVNGNVEAIEPLRGSTSGAENYRLTQLFSLTPFESVDPVSTTVLLKGEYDGSTVKIESLYAQYKGTVVHNTGHVDKVYFNTNLSVDEVLKIITNIEYHTIEGSSVGIYGLLYSFPISLIIFKYSNEDYTILSAEYGVIWSSIIKENDGRPKAGWYLEKDELTINLNVNNVVGNEVAGTNFEILIGAPVGEQNNILSSLFSTTPFIKISSANTINIENYILNNKIPLQFKFTEKTYNNSGYYKVKDAINITENNTYDISRYAKAYVDVYTKINRKYGHSPIPKSGDSGSYYIYFNTSLNVDEMLDLCSEYLGWLDVGEIYCAVYDVNETILTLSRPTDTRYIFSVIKNNIENIIFDTENGGWIKDTVNIYYPLSIQSPFYSQKGQYKNIGTANSSLYFMSTNPLDFSNDIKLSGVYEPMELEIYKNGITDLSKCIEIGRFPSIINTHVSIPEGYIKPEGIVDITENGEYLITEYEKVNVKVGIEGVTKEGSNLIIGDALEEGTSIQIQEGVNEDIEIYSNAGIHLYGNANIGFYNGEDAMNLSYWDNTISTDNLSPENIKKDVSILGVTGTYESLSINGIIEEYQVLAGKNVSAGDFIEFVKSNKNSYYQGIVSPENSCNYAPCCLLLDDNRVFIAHPYDVDANYLHGTIVEIDGDTISATTTLLNGYQSSCVFAPSCVLLEANKVFIAHGAEDANSRTNYLHGTIVEIDGTEMTATTTQLISGDYNNIKDTPSCVLLEANKVFIACAHGYQSILYGAIVGINGTTMNVIFKDSLDVTSGSYCCEAQPTCLLLENNKVFISYSSPDMSTATRIAIVQIDGTTVTATIAAAECFPYTNSNCILLENNKVFIAYRDTWMGALCGGIAEIDGTEVTITMTELCLDESNCNYIPNCLLLEDNKVLIVHSYGEENYLYKTVVDINGTEMTATTTAINSTTLICNNSVGCISLDANNIFIAHVDGENNNLSATKLSEVMCVRPYELTINGVAKTSGASGEVVEVYTPNK